MYCPVCRSEVLLTVEYDDVELDFCEACGGVWLDAGEIEYMVGDHALAEQILSLGAPVTSTERQHRCPECRAKMTKEQTSAEHPVTFDHCPNGDGLWFDRGELREVLHHAEALGAGAAVVRHLQSIFGSDAAGAAPASDKEDSAG